MLTYTELIARGTASFGSGIADLQVVEHDGESWLFAQSGWTAGVTSYRLTDDGRIYIGDQQSHAAGTDAFYDGRLAFTELPTGPALLSLAHGEDGLQVHAFSSGGSGQFPGNADTVATGGGSIRDAYSITTLDGHVYIGSREGGISVWSMNANGSLSFEHETSRDDHQTDMAVAQAGGRSYLISVLADGHAVTSWRVASNGRLSQVERLEMGDGPGIAAPNQVEAVTLGDATYVIVGGAQSGTLSVFALDADGHLQATDHVLDGRETRFAGSSALTVLERDGVVFVAAGGADDGISLFLMLDGGKLLHMDTMADEVDRPMQNVEALAAHATDTGLQLFLSSEAEDRIGRVDVDLTRFGEVLSGGAGDDRLTGGPLDDVLVAGEGADRLTGGSGRDIFVIEPASGRDTIEDYETGRDVVDLSLIPMLYSRDQLEISSTSYGARIVARGQEIIVRSADGAPLDPDDVALDFGPAHFLLQATEDGYLVVTGSNANDKLSGGSDDDSLRGLGGDDMLYAGEGRDIYDGGDGFDTVSFENAQGRVLVDQQLDVSTAGYARFFQWGDVAGATYENVEAFIGGRFSDNLRGDAGQDSLHGSGGWDRLYGRAGDDTLNGGTGGDAIYGNRGADVMTGGPDAGRPDRYIYFGTDDTGVGAGQRDIITDFVSGEDRIEISRIDADVTTGRNQAFDFIGAARLSGTAGELGYRMEGGTTIVQADFDGDGQADFEIELTGNITLSEDDFLL